MRASRFGAVVVLVLLGCEDPGEPDPPPFVIDEDFVIETDSTQYHLRQDGAFYTLTMEVRVTNPFDRTVYLHRKCGYYEFPARYPVRADDDTTAVWLDDVGCITAEMLRPIPLPAGDTYVDRVEFLSVDQPSTTMAMRTGTMALVYAIQPTRAIGGWSAGDPFPFEHTTSNSFVVLPPE